jgi:hypothetical protein
VLPSLQSRQRRKTVATFWAVGGFAGFAVWWKERVVVAELRRTSCAAGKAPPSSGSRASALCVSHAKRSRGSRTRSCSRGGCWLFGDDGGRVGTAEMSVIFHELREVMMNLRSGMKR